MEKPHKHWCEDNVLLTSILVGIGAWVLDATLDTLLFSRDEFLHSLLLDVTPHEVFFRLFILIVIVLFGFFMRGTLMRRRAAEEVGSPLPELSMGMTGDFEVAIEEGATLVRIGTALFGARG